MHQSQINSHKSPVTATSLLLSLTILIIPLMRGGLAVQTLPVLTLLVGLAFLSEIYRFLRSDSDWQQSKPWFHLWIVVTLCIFGQPLVKGMLNMPLNINGIDIAQPHWLQTMKYWSYFTAYWLLAWAVSRQAGGARSLIIITLIAMALFQSLYGMTALVAGHETILGVWPRDRSPHSASGSFDSRNHLAGFLAVAIPLGGAYLFARRQRTRRVSRGASLWMAIAIIFFLITGAALIATASRLGIFSAFIGLVVWGWLYSRSEAGSGGTRYMWLTVAVGLPILAGLWFGPGHLIERLFQLDENFVGRASIWQAMLAAPDAVWLHGVGAGAFQDAYKLISPAGQAPSIWRGHSEYLQFFFEFGLVVGFIIIFAGVYWYKSVRPKTLPPLQQGALAGVVAVLIHNIADFDFQVPGTAVAFWVSFGILFAQTTPSSRQVAPSQIP